MLRSLTSVLLIIAAIGIFFMWTQPRIANIQDLQAKDDELEEILVNVQELNRIKDALLSVYQSYAGEDLDRLDVLLPYALDNVKFILEVQQLAARYGISLQGVQESPASVGSTEALSYGTAGFGFTFIGSYQNFVPFMRLIEQSLRLIEVNKLSFNASDLEDIYQFEVELHTHWLR